MSSVIHSELDMPKIHVCNSVLLDYFGSHPMLKIIDFLIDNKPFDYSKKQIMEESGISKATLFKYFDKLEKSGVVKVSRTFGKTKLYSINMESPVVKRIVELELSIIGHSSPAVQNDNMISHKVRTTRGEMATCK